MYISKECQSKKIYYNKSITLSSTPQDVYTNVQHAQVYVQDHTLLATYMHY